MLSKSFYLGSYIGGLAVGILFVGIFEALLASSGEETPLLIILDGLAILYTIIITVVFIYKMWKAIQPMNPQTTPGKAAGFLFIPFFNFYWVFIAWRGFAQDFNRYTKSRGMQVPQISEDLALVLCICTVVSIIPCIGALLSMANLILVPIMMAQICDGVNAYVKASTMAPGGGSPNIAPPPPIQNPGAGTPIEP